MIQPIPMKTKFIINHPQREMQPPFFKKKS